MCCDFKQVGHPSMSGFPKAIILTASNGSSPHPAEVVRGARVGTALRWQQWPCVLGAPSDMTLRVRCDWLVRRRVRLPAQPGGYASAGGCRAQPSLGKGNYLFAGRCLWEMILQSFSKTETRPRDLDFPQHDFPSSFFLFLFFLARCLRGPH